MSNQVGDCFKFLLPFQNVQTLLRKYEFLALKILNLNTDLQKQSKNLQYLAGNLVLEANL